MLSTTATNVNWSDAIKRATQQQEEQAITTGLQHSQAYSEATTAALRELHEVGKSRGFTQTRDDQYHLSQASLWSESAAQTSQLVERFAHDNQLTESQAVQLLGQASAALGLSGSVDLLKNSSFGFSPFSAGVNGQLRGETSLQGMSSAQQAELFQHAKDYVQSTQLNQSLDETLRAAHDKHQRYGVEEGDRLTHQLNDHYEKAHTHRNEAINQFHQAESLRQLSSVSQENVLALSANLNQKFATWLSQQPNSRNTSLGITGAEQILNHQLEDIAPLAQQFIQEELPQLKNTVSATLPTARDLKHAYEEKSPVSLQNHSVESFYENSHEQVREKAEEVVAGKAFLQGMEPAVEQHFKQSESLLNQAQQNQVALGSTQQQIVNRETDPNPHNLTQKVFKNTGDNIQSIWSKEE